MKTGIKESMTKPASMEPPLSSRHCGRGFHEHRFYLVSSLGDSTGEAVLSLCFRKRKPRLREVE